MAKNIIIYSTPACVYCKMAKDFLDKREIKYAERDVAVDLKAREEMKEKSQQSGVPVIDIDGEIFVGFNRADLEAVLGLSG
jgi:glutaredoxin 3